MYYTTSDFIICITQLNLIHTKCMYIYKTKINLTYKIILMWESVDLPETADVRNENPYNMFFDVSVSNVTLIRNFNKI